MSIPETSAERRLAQYGERVGSFNCGDEQAMYRLACEMRDELVKARAALTESQEQATRYAKWLVGVRDAVDGSNFPDLPSIVRALPARHRAAALREADERIAALAQDYECDPGRGDAREVLRRMADAAGRDTPAGGESALDDADTCGRCRCPFDPADTRFDGRARHRETPFCRGCVDACHESTDACHECAVCRAAEGGECR
ncbi:hypothetical protein ACFW1M_11600 [Streptomyces inhibens]|uniref:hypothetical protein n=1 Tax=Streptomyces inhibens TaxID=2293571 RepID=UPI0036BA7608